MRLRTTAVVLAGALALALPTAGPSLADDGGRGLGVLDYRYSDEDGDDRRGQIRPADNDTCYLLTGTSRRRPAVEVRNETESLALLFENGGCAGKAAKVLKPGERARNVEVVAAFFRPVDGHDHGRPGGGRDDEGRDDQGRDDQGRDDEGRPGNGDWQGGGRDDQDGADSGRPDGPGNATRPDGAGAQEDLLATVFRRIG